MTSITFTHEEKLLLRILVYQSPDKLLPDQRSFLMMKLDKMLQEDGERLVITRTGRGGH